MSPREPTDLAERVRRFREAIDGDSDLDAMAMAVSAALQPGLDVRSALDQVESLAASCPDPSRDGVMAHLFGPGRFEPDTVDYHSWRNSCLDQVVLRRRGMPITLCVVAIETARRLRVPLVGIGLPGHFLVGDATDPTWFADPFHARTGLGVAHCRAIAADAGVQRWDDRFLVPTPDRLIIARILNNLRGTCQQRGDRVRLAIVMALRAAMPELADPPEDLRRAAAVLN